MALTSSTQKELYQFFAIAFDAAPGVTYMSQLADAVNAGMTVKQVVNVFTSKTQFTETYPNFFTTNQFATKLVNNVVQNKDHSWKRDPQGAKPTQPSLCKSGSNGGK